MIYIGADHRGFNLKEEIKKYFQDNGIKFEDCGNSELQPEDDFPDFAFLVGEKVAINPNNFGILVCGSGEGMTIAANKVKGIRAALCVDEVAVKSARNDSNANIIVLDERHDVESALNLINLFLNTEFSTLEKYYRRVQKIADYESKI